jgi:hypothetical protein
MAQIQTNPWSFTSADVATSVAISSIAPNGASALVTTGAAHGLALYQPVSLQGITGAGAIYNNGYKVTGIPSTTTFLIDLLIPLGNPASGASGNVLTVAYYPKLRAEQIQWSGAAAADVLTLTDTNGNLIWTYTAGATDGVYTYGKVFWVDGLVINALPHGTLLMTVN